MWTATQLHFRREYKSHLVFFCFFVCKDKRLNQVHFSALTHRPLI